MHEGLSLFSLFRNNPVYLRLIKRSANYKEYCHARGPLHQILRNGRRRYGKTAFQYAAADKIPKYHPYNANHAPSHIPQCKKLFPFPRKISNQSNQQPHAAFYNQCKRRPVRIAAQKVRQRGANATCRHAVSPAEKHTCQQYHAIPQVDIALRR